jgi:Methylamine utilisation protein MauE
MTTAATIWLVLLLGASTCLKARRPARSAAALATYGISGTWPQRVSLGALLAAELSLAAMLALGAHWAAAAAAALFLLFAAATTAALARGRSGRPCACFGSDSRLGWSSPARAAAAGALAGALALGWLPQAPSSYDRWLTVALTLSLAAVAGMGVGLLALAREVGVLRLGMAGRGALEIPHEGPAVGSTQAWAGAIGAQPRALLRLAVFTSDGCPLCRQLAPAVAHVAADPMLAVRSFDEVKDPAAWSQARVPGSPYAVALSLEGVVLSKGTFNSLGQLESILGTARARQQELPVAA